MSARCPSCFEPSPCHACRDPGATAAEDEGWGSLLALAIPILLAIFI